MIQVEIKSPNEFYQILVFTSDTGKYERSDISEAIKVMNNLPLVGTKGIVISFRGPIWLHSAIALHLKNKHTWIAHYDPKEGGAIVTFSLSRDPRFTLETLVPIVVEE